MVADGLLTRQRYREVPPRVDYELTDRAKDLMPVLGALALWGYEWAWSSPREGEDIDVGAILRLAPGLLRPPKSLRGTVAIDATAKKAKPRSYVLMVGGGRVDIAEREESDADARVSGPQRAWIDAFRPDGDRSGLTVEGDRRLAETLLDGIAGAAADGRTKVA
jgi:HxlR-like helix-turn-helix